MPALSDILKRFGIRDPNLFGLQEGQTPAPGDLWTEEMLQGWGMSPTDVAKYAGQSASEGQLGSFRDAIERQNKMKEFMENYQTQMPRDAVRAPSTVSVPFDGSYENSGSRLPVADMSTEDITKANRARANTIVDRNNASGFIAHGRAGGAWGQHPLDRESERIVNRRNWEVGATAKPGGGNISLSQALQSNSAMGDKANYYLNRATPDKPVGQGGYTDPGMEAGIKGMTAEQQKGHMAKLNDGYGGAFYQSNLNFDKLPKYQDSEGNTQTAVPTTRDGMFARRMQQRRADPAYQAMVKGRRDGTFTGPIQMAETEIDKRFEQNHPNLRTF